MPQLIAINPEPWVINIDTTPADVHEKAVALPPFLRFAPELIDELLDVAGESAQRLMRESVPERGNFRLFLVLPRLDTIGRWLRQWGRFATQFLAENPSSDSFTF